MEETEPRALGRAERLRLGTQPVRWGIISTARINERVLPEVEDSEQVELLAVASRSQSAADDYAARDEFPRAYGSYEALLADQDVEAVYIPLPNSLHVEWTIRALEAGKHVLCEKPLDRRAAQVARAFDAAERARLILTEGFMYRHHPQTRRVEELVATGAIGELRVLRSSFGFMLDRLEDVRLRADLDGGSLMDVGCYCVSASRLLAGEPETAIGRQVTAPSGVDVRFSGMLVFAGGVMGLFDCGLDVPDNSLLEVVGSQGTLRVPAPFLIPEPSIELSRGGVTERIQVPQAGAYRLEFEDMSTAIRAGGEPLLGRADALGQARVIEALYRSADRGGELVAIPPETNILTSN
jgi:D-xylose 1-dehydrogenase (NADP+, D-xylono-1,5-lactone-forming)